jgi:Holliday junction resolvasome RuvABC endonuclease subunit
MSTIKVVAFDPSLTNFGAALASVDVNTLKIEIEGLTLSQTEPETKMGVKKNSDDLRRALVQRANMVKMCEGRTLAIAEIPMQTTPRPGMLPSIVASASYSAGIMIGVLAGCPIPLIQVFPQDVKLAVIGKRNAAKEEMIEWAMEKYPAAPWRMRKQKVRNGEGYTLVPTKDNEHLADAVAILETGIMTVEFKQALSMFSAFKAAA